MLDAPDPKTCAYICTMWRNGSCTADLAAALCKHRPVGVCPHGSKLAREWAMEKSKSCSQ